MIFINVHKICKNFTLNSVHVFVTVTSIISGRCSVHAGTPPFSFYQAGYIYEKAILPAPHYQSWIHLLSLKPRAFKSPLKYMITISTRYSFVPLHYEILFLQIFDRKHVIRPIQPGQRIPQDKATNRILPRSDDCAVSRASVLLKSGDSQMIECQFVGALFNNREI